MKPSENTEACSSAVASNAGLDGIRTLGQIVREVIISGEHQVMTQEEYNHFHTEFVFAISPEIDRIRVEQIQAFATCHNLVLD